VIEVDTVVSDERWEVLGDAEELARRAVDAVVAVGALAASEEFEVTVAFVGDESVQALNRQWRGKDQPTNVLSFPAPATGTPGPRFLGDVVLAFETVSREAAEERKPVADHVLHLLVHGILHLRGYAHETDEEAAAMESLEVEALAALGVADPYRDAAA